MPPSKSRKPPKAPAPAPLDPACVVSVGAPILPVGVQFSVEVPLSLADEATVKLVELARLVEPHLGLRAHEIPRAEHVPGMGAVEVVDDDGYDAAYDARRGRRRVGFTRRD